MVNRVGQWGGSLTVRIPKNVVEALSIRKGDALRIYVGPDNTLHVKTVKPVPPDGAGIATQVLNEPDEITKW